MRFTRPVSRVLDVSTRGSAKILTMNDAPRHNALSLQMLSELQEQLDMGCKDYRALVIQSAGKKVFCAGHDLTELKAAAGKEKHQEIFDLCKKVMKSIREIDVPVICAVDGAAAAAGSQLVAGCDIVLASGTARFSVPGAKLGIFCHSPAVELARVIPQKQLYYMLTTGSYINAFDAQRFGLVSRYAGKNQSLDDLVDITLKSIEETSRSVQAIGKKNYYSQIESNISTAADNMANAMVENLSYRDTQNGISAFLNKEEQKWSHTDEKV